MNKGVLVSIGVLGLLVIISAMLFPLFQPESVSSLKPEFTLLEEGGSGTWSVRINYKGDVFVGINGQEIGSGSVSEKGVSLLNSMFKRSKFFSFNNEYVAGTERGIITTISYTSSKKNKSVKVMDGANHPEGFDYLVSELKKVKDLASANVSTGHHALDYSWVVGQLRYNRLESGFWEIIFVDEINSPYGGRFVLGNPAILSGFSEGDKVKVTGSVKKETGNIFMAGTPYEVQGVVKIVP